LGFSGVADVDSFSDGGFGAVLECGEAVGGEEERAAGGLKNKVRAARAGVALHAIFGTPESRPKPTNKFEISGDIFSLIEFASPWQSRRSKMRSTRCFELTTFLLRISQSSTFSQNIMLIITVFSAKY
jgi:hypothetical protein